MSQLIPEPSNFAEVSRLPSDVKKAWLESTFKYIKNIINNHTFIIYDPEKGYPVIPCMGVYKSNIQYDGSLDKLMFIIVVRGDFQNKEIIGYTWDPTASMSNLKYFLEDLSKNIAIEHQFSFIV